MIIIFGIAAFNSSYSNNKDLKIVICHRNHQLVIPLSALEAHLKHGDTVGSCIQDPIPPGPGPAPAPSPY